MVYLASLHDDVQLSHSAVFHSRPDHATRLGWTSQENFKRTQLVVLWSLAGGHANYGQLHRNQHSKTL